MSDLLVIGAGVGGLTAAVSAAETGRTVTVVHKPAGGGPATAYAQGGIAVVDPGDPDDSVARHVADTHAAGGPLVDPVAAESILGAGPEAVARLISWGAVFDADGAGRLRRTREGGHTVARIIHAGGDATGAEVARALLAAARARGVRAHPGHVVTLLRSGGAIVGARVIGEDGALTDLTAGSVVLATGGAGHLYSATTNPLGCTGDGIALAVAAGAAAAELDCVQFHPTMLFTAGIRGRRALISEALRGEGAVLRDIAGNSVTAGVHPMGDLAPRDVVARAVADAMTRTGAAHVFLDARMIGSVSERFPTVTAAVRGIGLDPAVDLIPVSPGAHYLCGGVVTDSSGATTVEGLFAAGEVARTGLHGANRLASNSLLEALVMGLRVGASATAGLGRVGTAGLGRVGTAGLGRVGTAGLGRVGTAEAVPMAGARADRAALQDLMSTHAGVRRSAAGLQQLCARLDDPAFAPVRPALTGADHEDAALTAAARLVSSAARQAVLTSAMKAEVPV